VATLTHLPATRTEDEVAPQDLARLKSRQYSNPAD